MTNNDSANQSVQGCEALDVGTYRYKAPWLMLVFALGGSASVILAWHSHSTLTLIVALGAEILFVMAFFEHKTYTIELGRGIVRVRSCFHSKSFALADVDLFQHTYSSRQSATQNLYFRAGHKILLKANLDLDGFDDLVGLMRAYAHRHWVEFKTRDDWGTWT